MLLFDREDEDAYHIIEELKWNSHWMRYAEGAIGMNKYIGKMLGILYGSKQFSHVSRVPGQQSMARTPEEWHIHWQMQKQLWRTEPEIPLERQQELSKCRAIVPDIKKGVYPFRGMKLSRADVEWLLATHENGRGPVDWSDESQHEHVGLDLRGADLCRINLHGLPLNCVRGGLTANEWINIDLHRQSILSQRPDERLIANEWPNLEDGRHIIKMAAVQLEGTLLMGTQLNGSYLVGAQLNGCNLVGAQLNKACLIESSAKWSFACSGTIEPNSAHWGTIE